MKGTARGRKDKKKTNKKDFFGRKTKIDEKMRLCEGDKNLRI